MTVNSILGNAIRNPDDALAIARRAREFGFTATVGVLHDSRGQAFPLTPDQNRVYQSILRLGGGLFSFAHYDRFQWNIVRGEPNDWHCRAGGRFLYVSEDGLMHYRSQRRGRPGIPFELYMQKDLQREGSALKPFAPFFTISCVHQTAMLDAFRETPRDALAGILQRRRDYDPAFRPPWLVKALAWLFLGSPKRTLFGRLALRVPGIERLV